MYLCFPVLPIFAAAFPGYVDKFLNEVMMKKYIAVFVFLICSPSAFATPKFVCHGTYANSSGGILVVPDMSTSGGGEVSMEYMSSKIPCPSTVVDERTIKMTCGAGSMDANATEDCKTLNVGGLPYHLK